MAKINRALESIRFVETPGGGEDFVVLDNDLHLLKQARPVPKLNKHLSIPATLRSFPVLPKANMGLTMTAARTVTKRSKFNVFLKTHYAERVPQTMPALGETSMSPLNRTGFALRSFQQQELQRTALQRMSTARSPTAAMLGAKPQFPVLKIIIDAGTMNPFKYNPNIPMELPTRMNHHAMLREIATLQLRYPELHATRFDVSDLFEASCKELIRDKEKEKELDSEKETERVNDFVYAEWLSLYKLLAGHFKYLREVFLSYSLNHMHRSAKLEFTPDSLHLETLAVMHFAVFKEICEDMKVTLDDYAIMCIFYISSRCYKQLPSISPSLEITACNSRRRGVDQGAPRREEAPRPLLSPVPQLHRGDDKDRCDSGKEKRAEGRAAERNLRQLCEEHNETRVRPTGRLRADRGDAGPEGARGAFALRAEAARIVRQAKDRRVESSRDFALLLLRQDLP